MESRNGRIGSSFDAYLRQEGIHEEATAQAVKRVLAWQLEQAMADKEMSKNRMAKHMKTSRSQLDRLLNPAQTTTQLDTLFKAAHAVGREIRIQLA